MNPQTSSNTSHLKSIARPSLYTSDKPSNNPDKNVSILASLEGNRSDGVFNRKMRLMILVGILLLTIAYWSFQKTTMGNSLALPTWAESVFNTPKMPQPEVVAMPPAVIAMPSPPILIEESHAAVITIDDSTLTKPEFVPPQLSVTKELSTPEPDIVIKPKIATPQTKVIVAAGARNNNPKIESADTVLVLKNKVSKQNTVVAKADTAPKPITKTTVATKNGKDADVDLIAALLSRVSSTDASGKDVPPKSTRTPAKKNADQVHAKRENRGTTNREIIVRTPAESTEVLVKRCRALGFFEGELCRIRICSERWGIDPACPGPVQTVN